MRPIIKIHGSGQRGLSLVEILVAMAILIFGLTITAIFSRTITQSGVISRQHGEAVHLARSRLEQLRHFRDRAGYDAIVSGNGSVASSNTVHTLTWTITSHTNPDYKGVTVKDSWVDSGNATRTVELASVIAWNDPLQGGKILQ